MSAKGAPWQNGYKESFYSHFKAEAGDIDRFDTLGELVEFIYQQIYYGQSSTHSLGTQDATGGMENETECLKNRVLDRSIHRKRRYVCCSLCHSRPTSYCVYGGYDGTLCGSIVRNSCDCCGTRWCDVVCRC
jgi:hypothetical protein